MLSSETLIGCGFLAWTLYQGWRGYRDGVWLCLINLVAILLAYLSAIGFGRELAGVITKLGIPGRYSSFIAYPSIFLLVQALVRFVPLAIWPSLKQKTTVQAIGGAVAGLCIGALTGLVGVWLLTMFVSLSGPGQSAAVAVEPENRSFEAEKNPLQKAASVLVSESVAVGGAFIGADEDQLVGVSAMLRYPEQVLGNMQEAMKSPEMRSVIHSAETTRMMAMNDANSLMRSEAFQEMIATPSMQSMLHTLAADGKSDVASEMFIAEQLTRLWRRMEYLKSDPRVNELLKDQELQQSLEKNNPVALMANPKFQRLVALILDGTANVDESQLSELLSANGAASPGVDQSAIGLTPRDALKVSEPSFSAPKAIFKWQDDQGKWHYTDWERVPLAKREQAVEFK